jgi:predicted RND superfamily exporter protein
MEALVITILVLLVIFLFFVVKSKNRLLENNEIVFHKKESILTDKLSQKETSEKELHKNFLRMQLNKVNPRKEFFKVTLKEIREEIEKLNIITKWTMAAAAREYRESLAIERAIVNDQQKQKEWENSQILNQDNNVQEVIEEVVK